MTKTKFGMIDKSGKEVITHVINLKSIDSKDPIAFAYGFVQGERGEKLSKDRDLSPEYVRGWKEGRANYKKLLRKVS